MDGYFGYILIAYRRGGEGGGGGAGVSGGFVWSVASNVNDHCHFNVSKTQVHAPAAVSYTRG